ncbi:type II toxin-antitoxin system PrlF family antitoxin [Pseudomonas sp. NPDC090201]|uniref:type II toxin-antitoxin system PrlF family antitoxin n=1 Tax=Pseudomonas sp. NPDC090201 TaxID=3364475 RepID=UPI0037F1B16A
MSMKLSHDDVLGSLKALDDDIEAHPDQIKPLDPTIALRVQNLVREVEIDLEAPLSREHE